MKRFDLKDKDLIWKTDVNNKFEMTTMLIRFHIHHIAFTKVNAQVEVDVDLKIHPNNQMNLNPRI